MKKILIMITILSMVFVVGCSNNEQVTNRSNDNTKSQNQSNSVLIASDSAINTLSEILNNGYTIVDKSKVYIYKSKDFKNAYFIGTLVQNGNQQYNCIWVTNDEKLLSTIYSMNDYAEMASGIMQGSQTDANFSVHDDGYHQINSKVLSDWNKLLNK